MKTQFSSTIPFRKAFLIITLFVFFGCSKKSLNEVSPDVSARKANGKFLKVTWAYLEWMAASGQNPSIAAFLKAHRKHGATPNSNAELAMRLEQMMDL